MLPLRAIWRLCRRASVDRFRFSLRRRTLWTSRDLLIMARSFISRLLTAAEAGSVPVPTRPSVSIPARARATALRRRGFPGMWAREVIIDLGIGKRQGALEPGTLQEAGGRCKQAGRPARPAEA